MSYFRKEREREREREGEHLGPIVMNNKITHTVKASCNSKKKMRHKSEGAAGESPQACSIVVIIIEIIFAGRKGGDR